MAALARHLQPLSSSPSHMQAAFGRPLARSGGPALRAYINSISLGTSDSGIRANVAHCLSVFRARGGRRASACPLARGFRTLGGPEFCGKGRKAKAVSSRQHAAKRWHGRNIKLNASPSRDRY